MAAHLVEELAEDAIAAMLSTQAATELTGVTVYKGFSGSELAIPRLEVFAFESEPELVGSAILGNHYVKLQMTIATSADDTTRAAHSTIVAGVRDALMCTRAEIITNIEAEGTAAFTAFDYTPGPTRREGENEDRLHKTEIEGTLYCCVTDSP